MKVEEILKPKSLEEMLSLFCDKHDIPLVEMREFLGHDNAKKEFLLKYVDKAQKISNFLSKIKTDKELEVGDLVYHKTNHNIPLLIISKHHASHRYNCKWVDGGMHNEVFDEFELDIFEDERDFEDEYEELNVEY